MKFITYIKPNKKSKLHGWLAHASLKQVIAVIADSIIYPMKIDADTFTNIEKSEGRPRAA